MSSNVNYSTPYMKQLCLITGNKHKVDELNAILNPIGLNIINEKIDLPEIQGTPEEVARAKAKVACEKYGGPVLTDDVSFVITEWKSLPGAYIKDFLLAVGPDGVVKMLDGFQDKSAYAQCIYCYQESPEKEGQLFIGRCHGKVVPNTGKTHFTGPSFDGIFKPDGYDKTFGEMDIELKNKISHRALAVQKLIEFLKTQKK